MVQVSPGMTNKRSRRRPGSIAADDTAVNTGGEFE
jgi:hypothetical protein